MKIRGVSKWSVPSRLVPTTASGLLGYKPLVYGTTRVREVGKLDP